MKNHLGLAAGILSLLGLGLGWVADMLNNKNQEQEIEALIDEKINERFGLQNEEVEE